MLHGWHDRDGAGSIFDLLALVLHQDRVIYGNSLPFVLIQFVIPLLLRLDPLAILPTIIGVLLLITI